MAGDANLASDKRVTLNLLSLYAHRSAAFVKIFGFILTKQTVDYYRVRKYNLSIFSRIILGRNFHII